MRVKPLNFEEHLYLPDRWVAKTPFTWADIVLVNGNYYLISSWHGRDDNQYPSFDAAERAANKVWKEKILKCLVIREFFIYLIEIIKFFFKNNYFFSSAWAAASLAIGTL